MLYTISFYEKIQGAWSHIQTEEYAFIADARQRFFEAISTCHNCAASTKIEWRKTAMGPKVMGKFIIEKC